MIWPGPMWPGRSVSGSITRLADAVDSRWILALTGCSTRTCSMTLMGLLRTGFVELLPPVRLP